jgi:hypothetical protein
MIFLKHLRDLFCKLNSQFSFASAEPSFVRKEKTPP